MKVILNLALLLGYILLSVNSSAFASGDPSPFVKGASIEHLKVEYAIDPLGIDIKNPQLSWNVKWDKRNVKQVAYQLLVADSEEKLSKEEGNIWNSGKVNSPRSIAIKYQGQELKSRTKYYWKVKVWVDGDAQGLWSGNSTFETAFVNQGDWEADWVGFPFGWIGKVLYFRSSFSFDKEVTKARAYVAGIGYSELKINGKKVGNNVLDPGTSEYSKRVYYVTHDVKDFLKKQNVILISVAPGWYGMPKLKMNLEITFSDGSQQIISSNSIRNVTLGPTVSAGILDGEVYDARKEDPQWDLPTDTIIKTIPSKTWGVAPMVDSPGGRMVAQHLEPIQVVEEISPKSITEVKPGVYVIDAGQNLAGWASLRVRGERGRVITLRFAESIYPDGSVNQENLRTAEAKDTYILKGGSAYEEWEPSFTYHGFRYFQVEGFPYKPLLKDFKVKRVRSAVAEAGKFTSSNPLLNDIWQMVQRTEASNLHSIPTDCPQRDERMGWMNDLTVRLEQAIYNFDLSRFYPKYLDDVADTQDAQGRITCTAPFKYGARPADPVSASYLLLALKSYEYYGNKEILVKHYNGLKAWVDYLASRTNNGILEYSYYGDWSPPAALGMPGYGYGAISKNTPGELMSTGFLYYCSGIIAQIAGVIGKTEDVTIYKNLAEKTGKAFNNKFWNEETGGYASNNQACNSFALFLGLADGDKKKRVVDNLVKDVIKQDYHLTTGNICTKYLLEVLTENGHIEAAYKIATQTTYPSWGYMLANGATTLWERWEHETGGSMNSHNHPMMGSVGSWMYKYLLGIIPDINYPGFERFRIRPYFPEGLNNCSGEYNSVMGLIKTSWTKDKKSIVLNVSVPANTTAEVYLPAKSISSITENGIKLTKIKDIEFVRTEGQFTVVKVGSGDYKFKTN